MKALVHALLEKSNLELISKNYRAVSNLSYLSKLIKKTVSSQPTSYTNSTGRNESLQPAYKQGHSTETALLKVMTDMLAALDNKEITCLVLLDLSTAFDTVSHALLLNWLKYRFSSTGSALNWIKEYLEDYSQSVVTGNLDTDGAKSDEKKTLKQDIPWGSVLGLILFTLYISPIGDIC